MRRASIVTAIAGVAMGALACDAILGIPVRVTATDDAGPDATTGDPGGGPGGTPGAGPGGTPGAGPGGTPGPGGPGGGPGSEAGPADGGDAAAADAADSGCGALTRCGASCVDTQTSVDHCGACGAACTIGCNAGACVRVLDVAANDVVCVALSDDTARCWGSNSTGQAGSGPDGGFRELVPVVVAGASPARRVSVGTNDLSMAMKADGTFVCWGSNTSGMWGRTGSGTRTPGACLAGLRVEMPSLSQHACAIERDAGGSVTCWGRGYEGQVSVGAAVSTPQLPVVVAGVTGAVQVETGYQHTCALVTGGAVICWGNNQYGQLGTDTEAATDNPVGPTAVTLTGGAALTGVKRIGLGYRHSCAVMADDTVACWGINETDRALGGTGTYRHATHPVAVVGPTQVVDVRARSQATCALRSNGDLWCWGSNSKDMLGDGGASQLPQRRMTNVARFDVAGSTVCAVFSDGGLGCWGGNGDGELGVGTFDNLTHPVPEVPRWR